jgi:chorismate mutase
MPIRGIRGATSINRDEPGEIISATRELLEKLSTSNPGLLNKDIASAIFSVTDDITSAFPAQAARQMGWTMVPMLCTREIPVNKSLPLCIRVLIHWNTEIPQADIHHVYLRGAERLRPDLAETGE